MHTAAGHPGDGRLGVGRKLRQVTPPTQVNKQKPPQCLRAGSGAPRQGEGGTADGGHSGPAGGRGARAGRRATGSPDGPGSPEHKVGRGRGAGGRTHPLGGIVLLHHSGGRGQGLLPGEGGGDAPGAAAPPSLPLEDSPPL